MKNYYAVESGPLSNNASHYLKYLNQTLILADTKEMNENLKKMLANVITIVCY